MKLSCLPVSLYPALSSGEMTLRGWFELAADLGLDGADVSVAHLTSMDVEYLRGVRAQANDCGVQIAMLVTYSDFTQPSAQDRTRQENELRQHIEAAGELGSEFVRVTAGQAHPGVARQEGVAWAVAGLTSALDLAEGAGITLAYENHTRGYGWTFNDFSQPADIFLEIIRRTDGSALKILFDTANNLAHGDDPFAVLDQAKHRVCVMHLNDLRRAGHFEPVLLGSGVSPVEGLLHIMATAGFDGWISVEEASHTGSAGLRGGDPGGGTTLAECGRCVADTRPE